MSVMAMTARNLRPQAGDRRGFTLIEILLAIGILAVGITAVLFLFAMGARSHRRAIDRTRSAILAETVINQIKATLADTVPANIPPIAGATHADFPEFAYDVTFSQLYPPETAFYKVRVVVRWGDPAAPRDRRNSETYETILRRKNY